MIEQWSNDIQLVSAVDYHLIPRIRCIVLVIFPNNKQTSMTSQIEAVTGWEKFVVVVTEADCHLVNAIRVPRIRMYENDILIRDVILNQDDHSSVLKAIERYI